MSLSSYWTFASSAINLARFAVFAPMTALLHIAVTYSFLVRTTPAQACEQADYKLVAGDVNYVATQWSLLLSTIFSVLATVCDVWMLGLSVKNNGWRTGVQLHAASGPLCELKALVSLVQVLLGTLGHAVALLLYVPTLCAESPLDATSLIFSFVSVGYSVGPYLELTLDACYARGFSCCCCCCFVASSPPPLQKSSKDTGEASRWRTIGFSTFAMIAIAPVPIMQAIASIGAPYNENAALAWLRIAPPFFMRSNTSVSALCVLPNGSTAWDTVVLQSGVMVYALRSTRDEPSQLDGSFALSWVDFAGSCKDLISLDSSGGPLVAAYNHPGRYFSGPVQNGIHFNTPENLFSLDTSIVANFLIHSPTGPLMFCGARTIGEARALNQARAPSFRASFPVSGGYYLSGNWHSYDQSSVKVVNISLDIAEVKRSSCAP